MCNYEEFRVTEAQINQSCNTLIGPGWTRLDNSCCSNVGSSQFCCGSNGTTTSPTPPSTGTGTFELTIVQSDSINNCHAELSNQYPTLAACQQAETSVVNDPTIAIDKDCAGTVVESPAARYQNITSLPYCGGL